MVKIATPVPHLFENTHYESFGVRGVEKEVEAFRRAT